MATALTALAIAAGVLGAAAIVAFLFSRDDEGEPRESPRRITR